MLKKCLLLLSLFFVISLQGDYYIDHYKNFQLILPKKYSYLLKDYYFFSKEEFDTIKKLTGNIPKQFNYIIEDYGIVSNGFTNPVYSNITIMTHIPKANSVIGFSKNWIRFVTKHETTHMAHLTYTSPFYNFLNKIFGNFFYSNMLVPNWYIEGIAVLSESLAGEGRLNDGFYSAYEKILLNEGRKTKLLDITYNFDRFPYGDAYYLHGGNFFSYLYNKYHNPLPKLFKRQGYSLFSYLSPIFPFLGMDYNSLMVMGKSFPALWIDWQEEMKKKLPKKEQGKQLTFSGDYKYSLNVLGNRLYYIEKQYKKNDVFSINYYTHIKYIDLNNETAHNVLTLNGNIFEQIYVDEQRLIFGKYVLNKGYNNYSNDGFGYEIILYEMNFYTKRIKKIYQGKIRSFTYENGNYYICIDLLNRQSKLIILNKKKQKIREIKLNYLIDSMKKIGDNLYFIGKFKNNYYAFYNAKINDLKNPNLIIGSNYYMITSFDILNKNDFIISSNRSGVNHIYRYKIDHNKSQFYNQITNGYFEKDGIIFNGKIYYIGLNVKGFDIYKQKNRYSKLLIEEDEYPKVKTDQKYKFSGKKSYNNIKMSLLGLFPKFRLPFAFENNSEQIYFGIYLNGQNTLSSISYDLTYYHDNKNHIDLKIYSNFMKPLYLYLHSNENELFQDFSIGLPIYFYGPKTNYSLYISAGIDNVNMFYGAGNFFLEKAFYYDNIYFYSGKDLDNRYNTYYFYNHFKWFYKDKLFINIFTAYQITHNILLNSTSNNFLFRWELGKRLFSLNFGMWNPNFYLKDCYIKIFEYYKWDTEGIEQKTNNIFGISFYQELKILFQVPLYLKITIKSNLKQKCRIYISLNISQNLFIKRNIKRLFYPDVLITNF